MKPNTVNLLFKIFPFVLLVFLASCKAFKPIVPPKSATLPATFQAKTDTNGLANLNWRAFFKDPFLVSLIDTALHNNLDALIAYQHIRKAGAGFLLSQGAFLPAVQGSFSVGSDKYGDYTMNGVGNFDTNLSENLNANQKIPNPTPDYFAGLRSSWEIDLWGKLRSQKKAAYARFLASQKGRHLIMTELVAQTANLYYELMAVDSELEIVRKNIILQQKAVEIISIQKAGGRATELAVQQSTAQLLRTQSLEFELQQELIQAENQLNLLLGRFPQPVLRNKFLNEQDLPSSFSVGIPSQMLHKRPDIQQAEFELLAAKMDVKAAQAAFLPSFTISAYGGYNAFKSQLWFNPASATYGFLGGLAAPLLSKNQLKSNLRYTAAQNMEYYHHYQKSILVAYQEVITQLRNLDNLAKIYKLREQEVELLLKAVSTANDLFVGGYATYLEVVTAQKSVLDAEINLYDVKKRQFQSATLLYRSVGGGWE